MKKTLLFSLAFLVLSFTIILQSQKKPREYSPEMNLHDFMEDYTKPASKLFEKKGNADYLNKILKKVPSMAPEEQQKDWKEIVDAKLAIAKPEDSCKACHTKFKKDYKKNFRKKMIAVPEEFKNFPSEIKALLKGE